MKIGILGTGAYAIALAKKIKKSNSIIMWTKFEKEKKELDEYHENKDYFPGIKISDKIKITNDLNDLKEINICIIALPVAFIRITLKEMKTIFNKNMYIINASKGIENSTLKFVHEIVYDELKTKNFCNLSGPTIAVDLATDKNCALTIASKKKKILKVLEQIFNEKKLKIITSNDVIGTEISGSIKNIYAIGSGVISGLNSCISTQAKYLTDCINEMKHIIYILGGKEETLLSYAGIGDLYMTTNAKTSRNFQLGYLIGTRRKEKEINDYKKVKTIEGLYTLLSIVKIIKQYQIEAPIILEINRIINEKENPEKLITL